MFVPRMTYDELQQKYQQAVKEKDLGNYALAESLCTEVLRRVVLLDIEQPEELRWKGLQTDATYTVGVTYYLRGDMAAAGRQFEAALALAEAAENFSRRMACMSALNTIYRYAGDHVRATEFIDSAIELATIKDDKNMLASSLGNKANHCIELADYKRGLEYLEQAMQLYQALGDKQNIALCLGNLGAVHRRLGNFSQSLEYYRQAVQIQETLGAKGDLSIASVSIGNIYAHMGENEKALSYYADALQFSKEVQHTIREAMCIGNIGYIQYLEGNFDAALQNLRRAHELQTALGNNATAFIVEGNIGMLYANKAFKGYDPKKSEEHLLHAIAVGEKAGNKQDLYECHQKIADFYKQQEQWKECAQHLELYHAIYSEVQNEEVARQAQNLENRRKIEEAERDRQVKLARFQEQERILHNILPAPIANRMIEGEKTIAELADNVSIFFSDIVGFTKISSSISAEELVHGLNNIFTEFDRLALKYGLEKIKTIGDAYMAVCGVPSAVSDHALRTSLFALDVLDAVKHLRFSNSQEHISMRIGLHTGYVVAGIIGENKFAYDLWGDAVNTAARMEKYGEAGKVHVSEDFIRELEMNNGQMTIGQVEQEHSLTIANYPLTVIPRGTIEIKGKGNMKTYFLERA